MFSGSEIVRMCTDWNVTDVVWLPDSVLGRWETELQAADQLELRRVCREGECWPLAAGLHLGGRRPLVMMQTTGLFESGDAMRNVLFDLRLPICALIGARSWLVPDSADSAKRFAAPILQAWQLDYLTVQEPGDKERMVRHLQTCWTEAKPGIVLLAEGVR